MSPEVEADVRDMARALSEIAHCLSATDDPVGRVRRALGLSHRLVRSEQCLLLAPCCGGAPELVASPALTPDEHAAAHRRLAATLEMFTDDDAAPSAPDRTAHLTLPLMGLDQVIGVIRVTPPAGMPYEAKHVRLLSVVAAQIGAYLALLKLHAEQERHARDLALVNEVQRTLAGIVSHDLRNPLQVITAVADSLLTQTTDRRQIEAIGRALRNAEKANRIINDLLDVSQARVGGTISIRPAEADLHALLRELVADERTAHPARIIELDADGGAPILGWWDPDRLSQLAINLVENALAHGDRGRPVTIGLRADEAQAVVSVHNHGPAIPHDVRSTIFDPFKRGTLLRRRGGGVGLGLYIVDQIARAHGGDVGVDSDLARGTTFTVTLPLSRPARDQPPDSARHGTPFERSSAL